MTPTEEEIKKFNQKLKEMKSKEFTDEWSGKIDALINQKSAKYS